ncbi:MAG: FKBP-type peptidyl-prolyl cis-trans isomerase [Acidilobus sp.]
MPFKDGDFVLVNYVISTIEGGTEVVQDTNIEEVAKKAGLYSAERRYEPYLVVIGRSQLLPAIDEELRNLDVGQKKEFTAPPEKAYGPHRDDLVIRVPIKQLNRYGITPVVGRRVEIGGRVGVIKSVTERFAYIDFNHPLAGKELKIQIEAVKKLETTEEKVKFLALRYMPLKESDLTVSVLDGSGVEVRLPEAALRLNDLESRLQLLTADLKQLLGLQLVRFVIEVRLAEGAKAQGAEAQPSQAQAVQQGQQG